jgi:L-threonylcarbamoyladenylate synthase
MGVAKSSAGRSTRSSLRLRPDIDRAAEIVRQGGLVAFPTETVYGLGADASNPWAVAQVFYVKERPLSNPLIVHISDAGQLADLAQEVPPKARRLAERFWPGPLTLVLPKTSRVSDLVTAGLPHVAIRVPRHPVALRLLRTSGRAIAAPSANAFGGLSPTTAQHVREQLGKKVIVAEEAPPRGLGPAINDRLRRAACSPRGCLPT